MKRNALFTFLVYTEHDSPYFVEFSTLIASSMDETSMTAVTGPKISSCAIRMSGFTSTSTVGSWKKPFASAPDVGMRPPVAMVAPSFRDRHVARDLLLHRARDDRTEVGRGIEAVAHLHLLRAADGLVDDVVGDALVRDDARCGGAALSGGANADQRILRWKVHVGVVEDHDGVLAAELAGERFSSLPAISLRCEPASLEPVNRNEIDARRGG
jgi:hypothetical protein